MTTAALTAQKRIRPDARLLHPHNNGLVNLKENPPDGYWSEDQQRQSTIVLCINSLQSLTEDLPLLSLRSLREPSLGFTFHPAQTPVPVSSCRSACKWVVDHHRTGDQDDRHSGCR